MPSRHRLPFIKKFGHEVLLVLGPLDASSERQREIGDVDIEMRYEGISSVVYGRTSDTMKPYQSRSFLDWILAGRDDSLSIRSRHALVLGGKQAV